MRSLFFMVCLLFTTFTYAQNFIEDNYAHFLDRDDITRVQVGERMFNIAATLTKDAENREAHDLVSKIKSFDLISIEKLSNPQSEFKAGLAKLKGFEELVRIKDKENNIAIMVDESNEIIHELVGIIAADSEFVVFDLVGEIDLNEISKLTSKLQDENLGKIQGISNLGLDEVKVYPNPVKRGSEVSVDVPANMIGGKVKVIDISGKTVSQQELTGNSLRLEGDQFNANSYFLEFENKGIIVRKKLIVIE